MTMEGFVHEARNTKPAQEEHSFWSLETKFESEKMKISFKIFTRGNEEKSESPHCDWGETTA